MGLLRGLIGFVFGGLLGGAALVFVTTNVPQFDDAGALEQTVRVDGLKTEPVDTTPKAVDKPVIAEPEPVIVETTPEVVEEQPKVVAPTPEVAVAEEQSVETPEVETPKIVWQSQETKAEASAKKFNLPTISTDDPADKPDISEDVVEGVAPDTGISVGKKPSASLPTITVEEPDADIALETAKDITADGRALELNATKYEAKDRPLLAVILLDVGAKGLAIDKLKKLNAPLTIAIRIDDISASERALAYHAAGFEVIAMASDDRNAALNTALNPAQIATALAVMFTTVPNAIGLLDSAEAKIQKNSRTAKTIVKDFINTGHGLVTYAKGLNSVDREARAAGVRTAKVARTLDANSENKALMVRYLDRASLDAGRDGAAIVLGTTARVTVATIAVWLLSSKGQGVSLAPASAVLLGQ